MTRYLIEFRFQEKAKKEDEMIFNKIFNKVVDNNKELSKLLKDSRIDKLNVWG